MMKRLVRSGWFWLGVVALIPWVDRLLPEGWRMTPYLPRIFIYAVLALGLNVIVGWTGLLHLGIAAFMAMGAYTYAILTVGIYPFQWGFWSAALMAVLVSAVAGVLLGAPILRLRGDYFAIVTLGFGEIMRDVLTNLEPITKGTQTLNPLPGPMLGSYTFPPDQLLPWYYLYLVFIVLIVWISRNLRQSTTGRFWLAIREDELAASCVGINVVKEKLKALAMGAGLAGLSGVMLAASLTTSGDPQRYDFNYSITALCIVILGGLGSLGGVLLGSALLMGFDSIVLGKVSEFLQSLGLGGGGSVFLQPENWKWLVFGLVLIFMMRWRREGLLPESTARKG